MMLSDKILNTKLEDNGAPYGGISFPGETVLDFMEDIGLSADISIGELNGCLNMCGIKSVLPDEDE